MRTRIALLQEWNQVLGRLLTGVRKSQRDALAVFITGVMLSGSVILLEVARAIPTQAHDFSTERRLRRFLSNERVCVEKLWTPLIKGMLRSRQGQKVILTLDPTPRRGPAPTYVLGLVTHKRVMPLAWHVVANTRSLNEPERVFVGRMFRQVAEWLQGCRVTLVADKGLTGPDLIRLCEEVGWHYVLRVSADAKQGPKLPDGRYVWTLVDKAPQKLYLQTKLFKRVGWIDVGLSVYWEAGHDQPWILVSDEPAEYARVREYRRRWQAESTYQDLKTRGWKLNYSRVTEPARVERLLMVLFIVIWWTHELGLGVIRNGTRKLFDRSDNRTLSVLRLGRCLVDFLLVRDTIIPRTFHLQSTANRLGFNQSVRL